MRRIIAISAMTFFASVGAVAQSQPAPEAPPMSATVVKFDNHKLALKTDKGTELMVTVPDTVPVNRARQGSIGDIKSGQYIHGITIDGPDGKLRAREIVILPDTSRGVGDGHFPRPGHPNETYTSGNIDDVANVTDGRTIKVGYKGGQNEVEVPQDAKVTVTQTASVDALKPGTPISLFAREAPPGTWTAFLYKCHAVSLAG